MAVCRQSLPRLRGTTSKTSRVGRATDSCLLLDRSPRRRARLSALDPGRTYLSSRISNSENRDYLATMLYSRSPLGRFHDMHSGFRDIFDCPCAAASCPRDVVPAKRGLANGGNLLARCEGI